MSLQATPGFEDRFWMHVMKTATCWLWYGSTFSNVYGRVRLSPGKTITAHRASWIITFGEIPDGLVVCHKCDVRRCVRPDHLFLGTHADNVHDCMAKNRRANFAGEAHPMAKLSEANVHSIRSAHADGAKGTDLAAIHSVSPQLISLIVNRKTWDHI